MTGEGYRHTQSLQYLANFPGARVEKDRIAVSIEKADGLLDIDAPLEVDNLALDGPLDVSAETVPVAVVNADELTPDSEGEDSYEAQWAHSDHGVGYEEAKQLPEIGETPYQSYAVQSDSRVTRVLGAVTATGTYSVWMRQGVTHADSNLVVEELASDVSGGETTRIDEPAYSLDCEILVVDETGEPDNQEVSGAVHVA